MSRHARWVIFPAGVAAIWTEERRKTEGPDAAEVPVDRVWDFTRWSKPAGAGKATPNRYQDHPVPYPRESPNPRFAVWSGDQDQDLRDWWHDRLPLAKAAGPDVVQRREQNRQRRLAEWLKDARGVADTVNR